MATEEELAQRLLSDPAFRAEFQRDPAGAARRAGLDGVAGDLLAAGDDPLQQLEQRESRSSLAGVVMAAAVEGIGIAELISPTAEASAASMPEPRHEHVDPDQYGMDGGGGRASAEALDLLKNRRVTFDADGIADLKAGRIDPRIVSVLTTLSGEHRLTISATASDHPKFSAGGSVSNHFHGRAIDIAAIDGRPVGPGNEVAKKVALELARLSPRIRPTEIGSPWPLSGPAYFTDAAHQNHLHVGFDDPVSRDWEAPGGAAAAAPVEAEVADADVTDDATS